MHSLLCSPERYCRNLQGSKDKWGASPRKHLQKEKCWSNWGAVRAFSSRAAVAAPWTSCRQIRLLRSKLLLKKQQKNTKQTKNNKHIAFSHHVDLFCEAWSIPTLQDVIGSLGVIRTAVTQRWSFAQVAAGHCSATTTLNRAVYSSFQQWSVCFCFWQEEN